MELLFKIGDDSFYREDLCMSCMEFYGIEVERFIEFLKKFSQTHYSFLKKVDIPVICAKDNDGCDAAVGATGLSVNCYMTPGGELLLEEHMEEMDEDEYYELMETSVRVTLIKLDNCGKWFIDVQDTQED